MHFALLDILLSNNNNNTSKDTGDSNTIQLLFRIVDHRGITVMYKHLPISLLSSSPSNSIQAPLHCTPYWGDIPVWRNLLFRSVVVIAMLVCLILPCLLLLWFLIASVYYVCIGAELTRRQKIEEGYQLNKDKIA